MQLSRKHGYYAVRMMAIVIGLAVLTFGCTPSVHAYRYIRLQENAIRIVEYGTSSLDGLRSHTEMPIRYELQRDQYLLVAIVDTEVYWPTIFFEIHDTSDQRHFIRGVSEIECFGAFLPDEMNRAERDGAGKRLKYVWREKQISKCISAGEPSDASKVLAITIWNANGVSVGQERLEFVLQRNGYQLTWDAV